MVGPGKSERCRFRQDTENARYDASSVSKSSSHFGHRAGQLNNDYLNCCMSMLGGTRGPMSGNMHVLNYIHARQGKVHFAAGIGRAISVASDSRFFAEFVRSRNTGVFCRPAETAFYTTMLPAWSKTSASQTCPPLFCPAGAIVPGME